MFHLSNNKHFDWHITKTAKQKIKRQWRALPNESSLRRTKNAATSSCLNWIDDLVCRKKKEIRKEVKLLFNVKSYSWWKHYSINNDEIMTESIQRFPRYCLCAEFFLFFRRFHASESNFVIRLNMREHSNYAISLRNDVCPIRNARDGSWSASVIADEASNRWRFNFKMRVCSD